MNSQNRLLDCSDLHKCTNASGGGGVNPANFVSKALTFVSIVRYYFSVSVLNSSVSCHVD